MFTRNHLALGASMLLLGVILSGCAASIDAPPGEERDPAAAEDAVGEVAEDAPEAVGSEAQALGELFVLHPGESRPNVTTWGWGGTTTVAIRNRGAASGALTIQAQTPWPVASETI